MRPYCPITKQGYRVAGHDVYRKTADATPGWRKAIVIMSAMIADGFWQEAK